MISELEKRQLVDRKAGWFAVAACRLVWGLLTDVRSRRAVTVMELYLDDKASQSELTVLVGDARDAHASAMARHADSLLIDAAYMVSEALESVRRGLFLSAVRKATHLPSYRPRAGKWPLAAELLADILRDIYGDLSARQALCGTSHKAARCADCNRIMQWGDFAARGLAKTIYDDRRFEDLPILADALEDAGCENAAILEHLRGAPCPYCKDALFDVGDGGNAFGFPQLRAHAAKQCACKGTKKAPLLPHARGCWALDLVLGER
jgi:hypothetical protein